MDLPSVKNLPVAGKKVLLRTNYDVPLKKSSSVRELTSYELGVGDETRIEESLPTIKYLLGKKAKIIIATHLGRPGGKEVLELSLRPVANLISNKFPMTKVKLEDFPGWQVAKNIWLLENLRFWSGEEANDLEFAKKLANLADFYVNEAFACSHRKHSSIVGVVKFFPPKNRAFGFDFLKEVEVLKKVRENPCRPVVLLLGGIKEDKIEYAKKLVWWADWILVGGKLVEYDGIPDLIAHPKIVGSLIKNGQDITKETAKKFMEIIQKAKTIVWAGPMGNFYNERYSLGTKMIAEAIAESGAFSVVGGGDTEVALSQLGLTEKISFISSGGGAMLEFLAEGSLSGIKAISRKSEIRNTKS